VNGGKGNSTEELMAQRSKEV